MIQAKGAQVGHAGCGGVSCESVGGRAESRAQRGRQASGIEWVQSVGRALGAGGNEGLEESLAGMREEPKGKESTVECVRRGMCLGVVGRAQLSEVKRDREKRGTQRQKWVHTRGRGECLTRALGQGAGSPNKDSSQSVSEGAAAGAAASAERAARGNS